MADRNQDHFEGAEEDVFRWPSSGLPRASGQPAAAERERLAPPGPPAWAPAYREARRLADGTPDGTLEAKPRPTSPVQPPPAFGAASAASKDPDGGLRSQDAPPWDAVGWTAPRPAGAAAGAWGGPDPDPWGHGAAGDYAGHCEHGYPEAGYSEYGYPEAGYSGSGYPEAGRLEVDYSEAGHPGRPPGPDGWRQVVRQASGGLVRPREPAARRREREFQQRVRAPVVGGHHRVAVLSLKGGVGKTTTVMGLGLTLASLRGDRVIAVDANPDRGTLCDRLRLETAATVRDLLRERDQVRRYADVRAYTTQASRLEVLASDRDPTVSVAFGGEDYRAVSQVLERYYSICVTDCGTGLLHSAMDGVLALADQAVLVSTPSVDGARSASATLDWLAAHGHAALARTAVVVLSMVRRRSRTSVDLERLEQHFAARCRAVVRVPHDRRLEEGAEMDLAELQKPTLDAYLALAAEVADGFARPGRRDLHGKAGLL